MRDENGIFVVEEMRLEYQLLTPEPGGEPTLVLLHEGLGCVALWKDFPRRIAEATGCRVLSYSRAGYGRSSLCPLPRPLTFMHDEGLRILPRVLDAAGIDRCVLLGHSDGASIALISAGGLNDPRIRGLILMAPHVLVEEITQASIRQAGIDYRTTDLRDKLERYHGGNVDCAFYGWHDAWLDPDFIHWNLEEYLPRIDLPVLLIQGEDDNYGTIRQLETIRRLLPRDAKQIILPNCGHSPFRDRPDESLAALVTFLREQVD